MRSALLIAITSLMFGCIHPAFQNEKMAFQSLPSEVKASFGEAYPDAEVDRVMKESFRNKHTGYNIWFVDADGEKKAISYAPDGAPKHVQPYRGTKEHVCSSH